MYYIIKRLSSGILVFLLSVYVGPIQSEPAVEPDTNQAKQLNLEGLGHFRANRFDEALQKFSAAAEADPTEPEYPNNAGVCYLQTQRFSKARDKFRGATSLKELPLYRFNEGLAALQLGEYNPAVQLFRRAVHLDPNYGDAWKHLGIAAFAAGGYSKAANAWETASELMEDPEVETNLGTAYLQLERPDEALARFEKAVSIDARYYLAHFNIGVLRQSQGQNERAEAAYQRAAALEPQAYGTYYNLALVQTKMGKTTAAINSLERFLAVVPPALAQQKEDARKRLAELREKKQ